MTCPNTVKEQIQNINAISKMESQTSPRWEIMRIKIVDFELRVVYIKRSHGVDNKADNRE